MDKIAIIGAGSWATALATVLAKKGRQVMVWARRDELARQINQGENTRYLPGVPIPSGLTAASDLAACLHQAGVVLFGVPSHAFRSTLTTALPLVSKEATLVNVAKGLEEETLFRMSEVFAQVAGQTQLNRYVALTGPSHAEEVGRDIPTAVVVAGQDMARAEQVQDLFMSKYFRVYTNPDLVGLELGGSLKNIIALGTGIADGLDFGDNTKAALMTRGLAEITRLGIAMGANVLTFAGLAGVGDLIVTCTSMYSRNRRCGIEIGKGKSLDEAVASVQMVVEGVRTTRAARMLAEKHGVEMPITAETYRVLFNHVPARQAVMNLMGRGRKPEMEEVALIVKNKV